MRTWLKRGQKKSGGKGSKKGAFGWPLERREISLRLGCFYLKVEVLSRKKKIKKRGRSFSFWLTVGFILIVGVP